MISRNDAIQAIQEHPFDVVVVGGGIPGWVIVVAAALLAAIAVWGGWVLYRRRLTANPGGPGH